MNYVTSRKFCCCFPVRIGVFVLSGCSAVASAAGAYQIWSTVVRTAKNGGPVSDSNATNFTTNSSGEIDFSSVSLDKTQYYAFIIAGIAVTIYSLFSIFGFIGSVFRRRALVAIYSTALWILLLLNLAIGSFLCWAVVQHRQDALNQCIAKTANNNVGTVATDENKVTAAACNGATRVGVALYIVVFAISWLIHLYACIIVKRYVEQLGEEQGYRHHAAGNRVGGYAKGGSSYYPHQPLDSQHELVPPSGPYPYAQHDHSFGSKS